MSESPRLDLLGYSRAQLESLLSSFGEKPYRVTQVMKWLHHRYVDNFDEMTDISKALRARFKETCEIHEPEVVDEKISHDGTRKFLMRSRSGSLVETVFIPEGNRGTLCVSSQVGCAMDCPFCATGRQGFNRNLTAAETLHRVALCVYDVLASEIVVGDGFLNVV